VLTRRKRLVFAIVMGLGTIGLCGTILVGYFALRARWYPFPRSDLRMTGDWPLARDAEIGFVAAPSASTLRRHLASGIRLHLYTDHLGARVNAPGVETPPRVDLMTVGCSFSWGHGIENEETYTEHLRRRLGIRVANFAMGSYGTVHSLLLMRRHLALRPRVIVYGFFADHLWRNVSPCARSYAPFCFPVAHVAFAAGGVPAILPPRWDYATPELNRRFYEEITMTDRPSFRDVLWRARVDLFPLRESRTIPFAADAPTMHRALRWLVAQMAESAREIGATLLVVRIPRVEPGSTGPAPPEVAEALAAGGGAVIDVTARFLRHRADPGAPSLMIPDGHPSAAGHALIADEIEQAIRARRLDDRLRPAGAREASGRPPA
jgi:hypothetical protein